VRFFLFIESFLSFSGKKIREKNQKKILEQQQNFQRKIRSRNFFKKKVKEKN